MDVNPCESCKRPCPYRLFIDCPIWLARGGGMVIGGREG